MSYVGINIGAVSVKVVCLQATGASFRLAPHKGRPDEVLQELLRELPPARAYGVCGHRGHIGEAEATNAALEYLGGDFDAIASLGGETFTVYLLADGRIASALAHNQCAAGSGEFLVQQVGRLAMTLDDAVEQSFAGHVVPMACRCSVHCKSDVTHKLNRKEATVADILRTLHDSMAGKVVSLLERARCPVRRLLLVGGLADNRALVAALREKLPAVEVVILPESACFEALGAALIARANPVYDHPHLEARATLGTRPPLAAFEDQVMAMEAPPADPPSAPGPFVLGLDAGSTTTKAVLLNALTGALAAWDYRRTNGDPVQAARQCLRAMAHQAGNRRVHLAAATGSARELIGAYLGQAHVYNEISAHAAAAARFDPDVDTIFEIGGQDAKYVLLRHGVPIDYAMNASCSAGTGSFLEECALNDLALPLAEISAAALRATAPVQFKATCAAFMNSDIRTALQEGRNRQDVAAGLVYAVVHNYLAKVKGPRAVGKNVFFQGGLAVNHAVACALAQVLGKPIAIPPRPELLGAFGAALLAVQRAPGAEAPTDLLALADPDMHARGHFSCTACANHCTIDRFEVAGRQFPFGGRCSRFEARGKHSPRPAHAEDLVEKRNALVLAAPAPPPLGAPARESVGIPRALTVHSLFPLYATFFRQLGLEVVLSDVDPAGPLKANSAFCFPMQIAHGAVENLVRRGLGLIFLPQVARMPNPQLARDSCLCPAAQASPYVVAKAFPNATFLSPVLDFAAGYLACPAMVDLAVTQLHVSPETARAAWYEAVNAQLRVQGALLALGRDALEKALAANRPAVLLVGRSYNAFPPEASQSVARKLASMGVTVIPGDCLPPEGPGPTVWHYPNVILNAVALARRHDNLFVLHVSNFSCTVDAFTHSFFTAQLADKPYLLLEIDAHTADAGVQTRLEAFWDIVGNYRASAPRHATFHPAEIGLDAVVTTSAGRRVPLHDPRVRIYFPAFSHYHSSAVALAGRWLGLNVATPPPLARRHLERGLRYTSGRECLPLPVCLGQMLEALEARRKGEIVGFYMLRGGAPCVVDCYGHYLRQFIRDNAIDDLFLFDPADDNRYYGLSLLRMSQYLAPAVTLADLFVEMEQALAVVGGPEAPDELRDCWDRYVGGQASLATLKAGLAALVHRVAAIPHAGPAVCPKVAVTGDFFLRFSPCFMEGLHQRYARAGIILLPVGLNELLLYGAYTELAATGEIWSLPPDSRLTVAAALTRLFRPEARNYLAAWAQYRWLKRYDQRYRALFAPTGLLTAGTHDLPGLFHHASRHLSTTIVGEAVPTVGKSLAAAAEGYDGILAVGPFNCLPFRISEAILKPHSWTNGTPLLTCESDGFPVSPAFLRQVDVHIQQVLANHRPHPPAHPS